MTYRQGRTCNGGTRTTFPSSSFHRIDQDDGERDVDGSSYLERLGQELTWCDSQRSLETDSSSHSLGRDRGWDEGRMPIQHPAVPGSGPRNDKELRARDKRRMSEYEDRKAWRAARLRSIANQWTEHRIKNSDVATPTHVTRAPKEKETWGCDSLFCCFA